jgi:hypothetical protein
MKNANPLESRAAAPCQSRPRAPGNQHEQSSTNRGTIAGNSSPPGLRLACRCIWGALMVVITSQAVGLPPVYPLYAPCIERASHWLCPRILLRLAADVVSQARCPPAPPAQTRRVTLVNEAGYLAGPPELIVEVAASSASIDLRDKHNRRLTMARLRKLGLM